MAHTLPTCSLGPGAPFGTLAATRDTSTDAWCSPHGQARRGPGAHRHTQRAAPPPTILPISGGSQAFPHLGHALETEFELLSDQSTPSESAISTGPGRPQCPPGVERGGALRYALVNEELKFRWGTWGEVVGAAAPTRA